MGAGGGGFLFYVDENNPQFFKKFNNHIIVPFEFEDEGSKIILIIKMVDLTIILPTKNSENI